jgi:hypothetical protein
MTIPQDPAVPESLIRTFQEACPSFKALDAEEVDCTQTGSVTGHAAAFGAPDEFPICRRSYLSGMSREHALYPYQGTWPLLSQSSLCGVIREPEDVLTIEHQFRYTLSNIVQSTVSALLCWGSRKNVRVPPSAELFYR